MQVKNTILITSNFSSDTGFAWKFFFRLFNHISNRLHEKGVGICLSFAKVVEPVTILDRHIPFHVFTFDTLNPTPKGVCTLIKKIRQFGITHCYLTDYATWHWLYAVMRVCGVKKIVVHSHVSVAAPYPPPPEKGYKKLLKTLLNNSKLFSADEVYACSEFVKDRLVRKSCYPDEKITIITHGIDIDRFLISNSYPKYGDKIVIFTVARATRHKGVHVLIEAARILRDKYKFTDFVVEYGGDGPDMEEFKKLVNNYNLEEYFIFLGVLDDTKEKTCNADIIVVPSIWGDAYPLSVIEAMSAGKPVIATDVGGIPEEIGSADCGVLIKPGDSEALAEQLFIMISDASLRSRIGENARKRAERMFTEKRFYDQVVNNLMKDLELD